VSNTQFVTAYRGTWFVRDVTTGFTRLSWLVFQWLQALDISDRVLVW